VDKHQDILRYCTSGAGNDHRLGGHEAPPAIFSVYLGDYVGSIVRNLAEGKKPNLPNPAPKDLGVDYLPRRPQDNTDRNRTSPVAFTGNKFEVRCVGASQQPAFSNLVLNTITADAYTYLANEIEKEKSNGKSIDAAISTVLQRTFKEHDRIINDGNGYAKDWPERAVKKGLLNLKNTPDVLSMIRSKKNIELFQKFGVWNEEEFNANVTVDTEKYFHQIHLESQSLRSIIDRFILPAGLEMYSKLKDNKDVVPKSRIDKLRELNLNLANKADALAERNTKLYSHEGSLEGAKYASSDVIPLMIQLREHADELETITDSKLWPFPTYEEMLFERHEL